MAEQRELTWTVKDRHKPKCIPTSSHRHTHNDTIHSTFINLKRKNENYCILSLSGIFISSYVRFFSLVHSSLSVDPRTISTLITIPIFTSALFFSFFVRSLSTDSASVVRDKIFIRCSFVAAPTHSIVESLLLGSVCVCVFFIRCVMAAIKIKQLLLYILCHVYYCCLLSIVWPMRYSICALFVIHREHCLTNSLLAINSRSIWSSMKSAVDVLHSFYVEIFMITDISVVINGPGDDGTACKFHFTRLV